MIKRVILILVLLIFALGCLGLYIDRENKAPDEPAYVQLPMPEEEETIVKEMPPGFLDATKNGDEIHRMQYRISASDAQTEYIRLTTPVIEEVEVYEEETYEPEPLVYYEEYESEPEPVVYETLPYVEEPAQEVTVEETTPDDGQVSTDVDYTYFTEADVIACAQMLWGEARGCTVDDMENCVRTVCNRCDDSRYPDSISECVSQANQYYGYSSYNPVDSELYDVAYSVLSDWADMKSGEDVEWYDYNSFYGNGSYNTFYTT